MNNHNMTNFPAAHSMDTTWFAVDSEGRVARSVCSPSRRSRFSLAQSAAPFSRSAMLHPRWSRRAHRSPKASSRLRAPRSHRSFHSPRSRPRRFHYLRAHLPQRALRSCIGSSRRLNRSAPLTPIAGAASRNRRACAPSGRVHESTSRAGVRIIVRASKETS